MKQFHWNHIDQRGKIHKVGLLHGTNTGHVLIHINGRISSIDFKVLDSKQYSFFINEELIELNIIKHEDHYAYTMEINEEVQTPLNEQRKKERKKMGLQTLLFFGLMAICIFGVTRWMMQSEWYAEKNKLELHHLSKLGKATKARLFKVGEKKYTYQFVTIKDNVVQGTGLLPDQPLFEGDEYMITYLPEAPAVQEINLWSPTPAQLQKTMVRVQEACQNEGDENKEVCTCMSEALFNIGGYPGLLSYLNKDVLPSDNPTFNRESLSEITGSMQYREYYLSACGE